MHSAVEETINNHLQVYLLPQVKVNFSIAEKVYVFPKLNGP